MKTKIKYAITLLIATTFLMLASPALAADSPPALPSLPPDEPTTDTTTSTTSTTSGTTGTTSTSSTGTTASTTSSGPVETLALVGLAVIGFAGIKTYMKKKKEQL